MKTSVLGQQNPAPKITPGNRTFRWQLDAGAIEHIIEGLSSLYIDPLFATCREEISNAMDANSRVAGAVPVEVSFPVATATQMQNGRQTVTKYVGRAGDLVVQDHGPGMDADELEAYFSYGFSDKRESSTERGGFGLGSKSPLSFVDGFRLISVKDGLLYEVQVHRDVTRVGLSEFLQEGVPTKRDSGVEIRIPITAEHSKRLTQDHALVNTLIAYPHGSILVNGRTVGEAIDNGGYLAVQGLGDVAGWVELNSNQQKDRTTSSLVHRTRIVLGGVLYDLPYEIVKRGFSSPFKSYEWLGSELTALLDRLNTTNRQLYLNMPLGSLNLPRSRDQITMDERNRAALITGFRQLFQLLPQAATARLNLIEDAVDAAKFFANNWGLWYQAQDAKVKELPDATTGKTMWHGHEIGGKINATGSWRFVTSFTGNGFHPHGQLDADSWPFYAAVRNRLSLVENQWGGLREPKADDFKLEADFILKVDQLSDAAAAAVEYQLQRTIRTYGRNVLKSENIAALITDAKELDFWADKLLPVVTLDKMQAQIKAINRVKRETPREMVQQTAKPLFYPIVDLNEGMLTEIAAGNIKPDAVYMMEGSFATSSYTNQMWQHVTGRTWKLKLDKQFISSLTPIIGSRQLIPMPKDRSLDSFTKRYAPDAVDGINLIATALQDLQTAGGFNWEVFQALGQLLPTTIYSYGSSGGPTAFLQQLHKHLPELDVTISNPLLLGVVNQIGGTGSLFTLLRLAQTVRPGLSKTDLLPEVKRVVALRKNNAPKNDWEQLFAVFAQSHTFDLAHARRVVLAFNAIMP